MMHNHEDHIIAQILSTVAPGDLVLTRYEQPQGPTLPEMVFAPALSPEGRGRIDFYAVFPGVHAALGWFKSDMLRYALAEPEEAVEIFYCHRGMMRWRMDDGAEIVLGAGEMMVQTMRNGAAATVLFPTGCAELFALSMAPKQIAQEMPDFLRKIGFSAEDFYDEVAARPRLVMAAHSLRTSFFTPIFGTPPAQLQIYLEWKVQEILWQTARFMSAPISLPAHYTHHVDIVREIHSSLVSDWSRRLTIPQLIKDHPIDATTFQDVFKALYGAPVGSYMRRRRMEEACLLLQTTDKTVEEVAGLLGYQSRSKFSQAFKAAIGESPGDYRKRLHQSTRILAED